MSPAARAAARPSAAEPALLRKSGKVEPAVISTLRENPWQPRLSIDPSSLEDLKKSIRDFGFIGYIPVRRAVPDDPASGLEIVYGHRRVRAAEELGHATVPVMLCDLDDEAMMRLAFVENSTQQRMTYMEEALHFAEMQAALGLSVRQLADMLGVSRGYIFNRLSLLSLPEQSPLRIAAERNDISMSNALVFTNLARVLDGPQLERLLDSVRAGDITHDDLVSLQKALDSTVPRDSEISDDGRRIVTATLVDQAAQRQLRPTIVQAEAVLAPPVADATPAPMPAPAAATREKRPAPGKPAGEPGRQKDGRDHALDVIEQLEGVLAHLAPRVEKADFSRLTADERARLDRQVSRLVGLLAQRKG